MPRTEARIFTSIWKDPDFIALEPSAQRQYLFLLSQDDLAYCGVVPLRIQRWAGKAAGLTTADVERDLKVLEAGPRPFIITDYETGELLVRSFMRRDGLWKQPNLLKHARESATQVESVCIREALLAELRRLPLDESPSEQVRSVTAGFIADLEKGSANPSDNPSENPSAEGSANHHARARELGERNGSSNTTLQAPSSDSPFRSISENASSDTDASSDDPSSVDSVAAQRDRRLGTRMPDPFPITPDMVQWARENCPHVNGKSETERFEDHWRGKPGKDGRKVDWVATWRNWMRRAEDQQGPRSRPGAVSRHQQETDDLFAAAERRIRNREAASEQ